LIKDNFNKAEFEVYQIIKEFLHGKAFFRLEEIIEYINYRLKGTSNISKNKIELILKDLIEKSIIVPGSKLLKENILNVPKRREIYDYICNNPGININEIMKSLEIGSNHALWHLKFLEKFQFVKYRKIDNQKIFFKFEFNPDLEELYYYLNNPKVVKILRFLENKGVKFKPTKIKKFLRMHYYTVTKYLDILIKLNLVIEDRNNEVVKLNHSYYKEILKIFKNI